MKSILLAASLLFTLPSFGQPTQTSAPVYITDEAGVTLNPALDRTTAGAPLSVRLSNGTSFYNATGGGGGGGDGSILDGVDPAIKATVTAGLALKVDGSAVTQPISASGLPLPTGASTSALQTTGNGYLLDIRGYVDGLETSVDSIDSKTPALVSGRVPVDGSGVTQPVSGTVTANLGSIGAGATAAKQDTIIGHVDGIEGKLDTANGHLTDLKTNTDGIETKLDTGNTSLDSIDDKTPSHPRSSSGALTAPASPPTADQFVVFNLETSGGGVNSVKLEALGTFAGDAQIEFSTNGTDYSQVSAECVESQSSGGVSNIISALSTTNRYLDCNTAGLKKIRIQNSNIQSGTANIVVTSSSASLSYYSLPTVASPISDDRTSGGFVADGDAFTFSAVDQVIFMGCSERGMFNIQVAGTFTGTLSLSANNASGGSLITPDFTFSVYPLGGGTPVSTITTPGMWEAPCGGLNGVVITATAWTSGSAKVWTNVSAGQRMVLSHVFRMPAVVLSQSGTDNNVDANVSGTVAVSNSFALDATLVALSAKFGSLGQKNMAGSAPVVIASDQSAVPVSGTVTVTDGSGPLTVDGTVSVTGVATETTLGSLLTSSQLIDDTVGTFGNVPLTKGLLMAGADGAAMRYLLTDSSGRLIVNLNAASVTANAGTNLNTSLLALESGGNLASILTSAQLLDDVIQSNGSSAPAKSSQIGGTDGTNTRAVAVDGTGVVLTKTGQDSFLSISFNESVAAPTAATWYLKKQWTPPASTFFRAARTKSLVTTAGSRTFIGVGRSLGTINVGTNAFAATGSVSSPNHYSRLIGCVTTVLSATPTNITVTYTDDLGNTSHATNAVTFAASTPVGNCFDFNLAATTGQMADNGVRAVTNITDSAATTGIVTVYGMNAMHDALGVANAFEVGSYDNSAISSAETIFILLQQAATTAQQRGATVIGSISTR